MIPTGNEFLCVLKKNAGSRTVYLFIRGNVSDSETGLFDQMGQILDFQIFF